MWDFLKGNPYPKVFMATTIILIPKHNNPHCWGDYRPIALSTVFSRILSKTLYQFLKNQLPKLISEEQVDFVQERNIQDNILFAKKVVQAINYSQLRDNAIFKMNVSKAYDQME